MRADSSFSERAGKRAGLKIVGTLSGTLSGVCPKIVGTRPARFGTQVRASARFGTLVKLGDQRDGVPDALTRSKGPARLGPSPVWTEKRDHFGTRVGKVLHMTNDEPRGYRVGTDARVVAHRSGAGGAYAVAVVLDEGPYSATEARALAARIREEQAGWVSKATAAERLGVSRRHVNWLVAQGHLAADNDAMGAMRVSLESLRAELRRREVDGV